MHSACCLHHDKHNSVGDNDRNASLRDQGSVRSQFGSQAMFTPYEQKTFKRFSASNLKRNHLSTSCTSLFKKLMSK